MDVHYYSTTRKSIEVNNKNKQKKTRNQIFNLSKYFNVMFIVTVYL